MASKAKRLLSQIKKSKTTLQYNEYNDNDDNTECNKHKKQLRNENRNDDIDPLIFLSQYSIDVTQPNIDDYGSDNNSTPKHSSTRIQSKFIKNRKLKLNTTGEDSDDDDDCSMEHKLTLSNTTEGQMSASVISGNQDTMCKADKRMKTHKKKVAKMKEKFFNLHSFSEQLKCKLINNKPKYQQVEHVINEFMTIPSTVIKDEEVQVIDNDNCEMKLPLKRKLNLLEIEMLMK